jgi:hypothetical protein
MKNNSIARILMSAAPIMIVGCLLASGAPAKSQSEDGGSHNRLQGAWRLQLTIRDCHTGALLRTFPALATFAKGGTLTMTTAGQPPSLSTPPLGVWRHTGDHTYSAVSEAFVFSPAGDWIQTHRLTRAIQIGDDTDEFTDTVALQIFDRNDNLIGMGCGTTFATRFK